VLTRLAFISFPTRLFAWPEGITAWAIIATLFAIVWQSFATAASAKAAAQAAKATADAANAQMNADRAWIVASVFGDPAEPLLDNLKTKGIIPGIVWQLRIVGNTPARIIRVKFRCRTVDCNRANVFEPDLESSPVYLSEEETPERTVVSPPGEKLTFSIPIETQPDYPLESNLYQIQMGGAFLVSYGRVDYRDAFGRNGATQFCAIYKPPTGALITSPDGTVLNPTGFRIGGPSAYSWNT
jgi:hypothetical protein